MDTVYLDPSFTFDGVQTQFLKSATARYNTFLQTLAQNVPGAVSVTKISISVSSSNGSLSVATDTSYNITYTAAAKDTIWISAVSQFGAQYGLETVSQLFQDGFNCASLNISDAAQFPHRGLLVDVAHRYFPISTLQTIMDGMLFSKLNVMNLHFADNGAVRVASKTYPELTSNLNGAYTAKDIAALVAYGHDRGIVVVPDVSLPSNAQGFSPVASVSFCANSPTLLSPDAATLAVLLAYMGDVLPAFSALSWFIGGDLGLLSASCNASSFDAFLSSISAKLNAKGHTTAGWEQLAPLGFASKTIYTHASDDAAVAALLAANNHVVYAGVNSSFLLNSDASGTIFTTAAALYNNNLSRFAGAPVLGSSVSIMTNNYCATGDCLPGQPTPIGAFMAARDQDTVFASSVLALIFPRASVAGASAWNLNTDNYALGLVELQARLLARGVGPCPIDCNCTEISTCGQQYQPSKPSVPTIGTGMVFAIVLFCVLLVIIVVSLLRHRTSTSKSGYSSLN